MGDISVPIPSPRGPVSCVVRNADSSSVVALESVLADLTTKARTDALTADDLAPATFGIVVGGKVMARPMMFLSLTYDHRLVDGREAVTFLAGVRDKMEDPTRLILDV